MPVFLKRRCDRTPGGGEEGRAALRRLQQAVQTADMEAERWCAGARVQVAVLSAACPAGSTCSSKPVPAEPVAVARRADVDTRVADMRRELLSQVSGAAAATTALGGRLRTDAALQRAGPRPALSSRPAVVLCAAGVGTGQTGE
jgi:hypothetical protein